MNSKIRSTILAELFTVLTDITAFLNIPILRNAECINRSKIEDKVKGTL